MLVCGKDVVERAANFEKRVEELEFRLSPGSWEFLLTLDSSTTLGEAARQCDVDVGLASEWVEELIRQGVLITHTTNLEEYCNKRPAAPFKASPAGSASASGNGKAPAPGVAFSLKGTPPGTAATAAPPQSPSNPGSIGFKIS